MSTATVTEDAAAAVDVAPEVADAPEANADGSNKRRGRVAKPKYPFAEDGNGEKVLLSAIPSDWTSEYAPLKVEDFADGSTHLWYEWDANRLEAMAASRRREGERVKKYGGGKVVAKVERNMSRLADSLKELAAQGIPIEDLQADLEATLAEMLPSG